MSYLRTMVFAAILSAGLLLSACGGNTATSNPAPAAGSALEVGSKGENLEFDVTSLSATAGQSVTVKFKNNSIAQQHNWVLVKGGDAEVAAVEQAGLIAGVSANYLPTGDANVLANTPLANGGETVEATFTAPAAGTYTFICTVPGHTSMRGTLTVN